MYVILVALDRVSDVGFDAHHLHQFEPLFESFLPLLLRPSSRAKLLSLGSTVQGLRK